MDMARLHSTPLSLLRISSTMADSSVSTMADANSNQGPGMDARVNCIGAADNNQGSGMDTRAMAIGIDSAHRY